MSSTEGGYYIPGTLAKSLGLEPLIPPPRFNGVPCPHYREVKKYQRELEQGGFTEYKRLSFEGETPEELVLWAKTLPAGAKIDSEDYEGGIRASWEEVHPLTEYEIAFRKLFIESHPIPEGYPDPEFIRWKKSVPFQACVKSLYEAVKANETKPCDH